MMFYDVFIKTNVDLDVRLMNVDDLWLDTTIYYQLLCIKHGLFNLLERFPITSPGGNHSILGALNVDP